MHLRYSEWITHVFDHTVGRIEWYHEWDRPIFEASNEDVADLVCETYLRSGKDLLRFSDEQVARGIRYLIDPGASDHPFWMSAADIPLSSESRGSVRSPLSSGIVFHRDAPKRSGTLTNPEAPT